MSRIFSYLFSLFVLLPLASCSDGEGETVESAYQLPIVAEPTYKFSRNGESNVITTECDFIKTPINYIYSLYLRRALLNSELSYQRMLEYYTEGVYGLKPKEEIAQSTTHKPNREKILADFDSLFATSARISGYGQLIPSEYRSRPASIGITGYIGNNIADKDVCYVDEKGIAPAEVYRYAIMGAIYLDKILNVHLATETLSNELLRAKHDATSLSPGHNYTDLEHHWDLGYGYYNGFWKTLARADGIPALSYNHQRIFYSLVEGRTLFANSRYNEIELEADTIKTELSAVVAVRAMNLLIGANTTANLQEDARRAFRLLSQAYGLIYSLQFTCDANDQQYFTYTEVQSLLALLLQGNGLWDTERLLADANTKGSLLYIATQIGDRYKISIQDIKK